MYIYINSIRIYTCIKYTYIFIYVLNIYTCINTRVCIHVLVVNKIKIRHAYEGLKVKFYKHLPSHI